MKKILSLLLCAIICLGTLSGCDFNVSEVLRDRAACFAEGKDIGEPIMIGADEAIREMLDQYNGSLYIPELVILPDDFQGDPDAPVFTVGCEEDLMKALSVAYSKTEITVNIKSENNFLANTTDDEKKVVFQRVHDRIRRAEPLHASGVTGWGWSETCVAVGYYCDVDKMKARKETTEQLVKQKADEIRKIASTEYEQIFELNRMLCNEVEYAPGKSPYPPVTHTPYGALHNHVAVCDGYSTAAMLILRELGIECDIQFGYGLTEKKETEEESKTVSSTEAATKDEAEKGAKSKKRRSPHAWNLVYLDNHWYQMDITWNDTANSLYKYFLVTDVFMADNHEWKHSEYPKTPWLRYHP